MKEAGHTFLARMGKRRLRPGGRKATEWLLGKAAPGPETLVMEAACNMGTTAIELARRYGCAIQACDLDEEALQKARANIARAGLADRITTRRADATALPFADGSFDVVLNEAMLTMLPQSKKEQAAGEYCRVLKPGGLLLTHDVVLFESDEEERRRIVKELSTAINVLVAPLDPQSWKNLFLDAGFASAESITGPMTLMTPGGMLYDEGLCNALRVLRNGLKKENRGMFLGMRRVFAAREKQLGFIATVSRKGQTL